MHARTGAHAIEAASDADTARINGASDEGARASTGRARRDERPRSPAVAAAESANERSNATSGSRSAIPATDSPKARCVSGLRESTCARSAALVIHAARIAEPLPPARSAYTHASGIPSAAATRSGATRVEIAGMRTKMRSDRRNERRNDEHEMHARHGEQVRETASPERTLVDGGEVVLAEDERARHRRGIDREGGDDPLAKARACVIDERAEPAAGTTHDEVVRSAREQHATPCHRRPRVARIGVPEAIARRELCDRLDLVAPRDMRCELT